MRFRPVLTIALTLVTAGALAVGLAAQPPRPAVKFEPIPAPADVAAPPADAAKTASGLASKILQAGTGAERPGAEDMVTVHYTGWTTDGKMFDSSHARNAPSTFGVNRVIKGWGEGVQLMAIGEKRRFWIPEALAYQGKRDPRGLLVFDIELLGIAPNPALPPPDVAAAPADAKKTSSGVAYKILRAGTGKTHPTSRSRVTVHYTGWTTDGKMFDSSVVRGAPATFGLNEVIPGWTEGVQLLVEGDKARFWIPQKEAYDGQAGMPRGMLVFDIELISHRAQ